MSTNDEPEEISPEDFLRLPPPRQAELWIRLGPEDRDVIDRLRLRRAISLEPRGPALPSHSNPRRITPAAFARLSDAEQLAAWAAMNAEERKAIRSVNHGNARRALLEEPTPTRHRGVYILLGLILGGIGGHNFYAGYYGRAVAELVACMLAIVSGLWPLALLVGLVVLVEIIGVDHDARGAALL